MSSLLSLSHPLFDEKKQRSRASFLGTVPNGPLSVVRFTWHTLVQQRLAAHRRGVPGPRRRVDVPALPQEEVRAEEKEGVLYPKRGRIRICCAEHGSGST